MLATQSIEARAQQDGCRQACTIGLSINEDTKLRKRKGEKKTGGAVGLFKYQKGRQGASSKRANGNMAEYGRSFVQSFCHVTPSPPNSTVFRQCYNITPPFSKACPQALYIHIILIGRSYLCALLVTYCLYYTSIPSIYLDTLVVQVY